MILQTGWKLGNKARLSKWIKRFHIYIDSRDPTQQDDWKTQDGRNKKILQKTGNAQSCKTFFRHSAIRVFQPSCCARSLLFIPHPTVRNRFEVIIVGCTWHSLKHFWWAASKQNELCLKGKRQPFTQFHIFVCISLYLFQLISAP